MSKILNAVKTRMVIW